MIYDRATVRAQRSRASEDEDHATATPDIDYLAKDYASFRRLLLDRLAQLIPDWKEQHIPDIGILLVELMAYVGDHLSYYQDAVATEAYLGTARQRTSVRRHARLLDYPMHEGCNARAFVCVEVWQDTKIDANDIYFVTGFPGAPAGRKVIDHATLERSANHSDYEVFEPIKLQRRDTYVEADVREFEDLAKRLEDADPDSTRNQQSSKQVSNLTDATAPSSQPGTDRAARLLRGQLPASVSHSRPADGQVLQSLNARRLPSGTQAPQPGSSPERIVEVLNRLLGEPDLDRVLDSATPPSPPLYGAALIRRNRRLLDLDTNFGKQLRDFNKLYFYEAHNVIRFDSIQGDILPRGTTKAVLRDGWNKTMKLRKLRYLEKGDVLIFEERGTFPASLAEPAHRHAVRLRRVKAHVNRRGRPLLEIEWEPEDALPWNLRLSELRGGMQHDIAVACGNVVLVDHGRTIQHEQQAPTISRLGGRAMATIRLAEGPLTYAQRIYPFDSTPASAPPTTSARALMKQNPQVAVPEIKLYRRVNAYDRLPEMRAPGDYAVPTDQQPGVQQWWQEWRPRRDLLDSGPRDPHFVVEMDDDRAANLRFGDGERGAEIMDDDRAANLRFGDGERGAEIEPSDKCLVTYRVGSGSAGNVGAEIEPSEEYRVTYRVGNGGAGNVGAEAISILVYRRTDPAGIRHVRNPRAAEGGAPPESMAEVKLFAPDYFRTHLERAITADDYADIVMREFDRRVQRATATLRWNGTRYDAYIAVDPLAVVPAGERPALCDEIKRVLARYRRMGHAVVVAEAEYVPIDLALTLYLLDGAPRIQIRTQVNTLLADQNTGLFAPNRLSFDQEVVLSQIIATVQRVPGVAWVNVERFHRFGRLPEGEIDRRFGRLPEGEIDRGALALGPFEIALLDPTHPEGGRLELNLIGGR